MYFSAKKIQVQKQLQFYDLESMLTTGSSTKVYFTINIFALQVEFEIKLNRKHSLRVIQHNPYNRGCFFHMQAMLPWTSFFSDLFIILTIHLYYRTFMCSHIFTNV